MNLSIAKLQTQKHVFTASLEHSITVLLLPHAELVTNIEQELQNNPLLESEADSPSDGLQEEIKDSPFDLNQLNALANLSSSNISDASIEEDSEYESPSIASRMTLEDHLFQQLYWEISDPIQRKIGEFIIGNLNEDGYLDLSCEEIVETLNITNVSLVKEILEIIQNFDPVGIGTKNLKESLIVQLNNRQLPHYDLAIRIIEEGWDDLGHKRYEALARKLFTDIEEITEAVHLIASLEPKPANNYRPVEPNMYVQADVYVRKDEEGRYYIETNKKGVPMLRINQTYRNLLNRPNISTRERVFIQEKLNNALSFIKNVQLRGATLTAVVRYILMHQKKFFDGEESIIAPMRLKDIAAHLDRCESTISRAINNKYVDTPQGVYPLKFFFSNNVAQQNHENVSAYTVKEEIAQLITEESKENPLSDRDIQEHFNTKGLALARRTITKYRQTLNIPSSHLRK